MSMNSSEGVGAGGSSTGGRSCGACKFLRRKCLATCIFAPYFDPEQGANHFGAIHKVFGASNVSKLLLNIPMNRRTDAVISICYEAQARLRDPIYGSVAHVVALQQQVLALKNEISYLQSQLAKVPQSPSPRQQVPMTNAMPNTYSLSTPFDAMAQSPWSMIQQRAMDPHYQNVGCGTSASESGGASSAGAGNADLDSLARDLRERHGLAPGVDDNASPSNHHCK